MAFANDAGLATKVSGAAAPETTDAERVVARVKREHAVIRALFDELERACAAAREIGARPGKGALERFRGAVWDLYVAFEDHLAMEEAHLAPLLGKADAWGEVRAARMIVEHNEQRRLLLELVEDTECDAKGVDALAAQAAALLEAFRNDMSLEERSLGVVLQDGGFVPDQEDG